MIQVLKAPERKISTGERLARSIGPAAMAGLEQYENLQTQQRAEKDKKTTGSYLESLGLPPGIGELPLDFQKKIYEETEAANRERIKGGIRNLEKNKSPQELQQEKEAYGVIENRFGKDAADLFKSVPVGGQTALVQSWLDDEARGIDVANKLQKKSPTEKLEDKSIDYDVGLSPKERAARQEARYSKNLPLYESEHSKIHALEHQADSLEALAELSPQISGWERLNINPQTGSLIIPALASPEAQRFAKIVNDFTVQAKESFGARVSNFELDRFMQRLPTLANSVEGRNAIIRQMDLITKMDLAEKKALLDVFEEHGGIRNLDYDIAKGLARKRALKETSELRSEFKKIDSYMDRQYYKKISENKKIVPKGKVAVQKADGTTGYIDKDKLKDFLTRPGNKTL